VFVNTEADVNCTERKLESKHFVLHCSAALVSVLSRIVVSEQKRKFCWNAFASTLGPLITPGNSE